MANEDTVLHTHTENEKNEREKTVALKCAQINVLIRSATELKIYRIAFHCNALHCIALNQSIQ